MNRSILAIAAALFAATTLFSSGASACISCEYVPEVVHTPVKGASAKRVQKQRVAKEQARPAKKRISKTAPVAVAKAEPVAKSEPATKTVETAAAPAETTPVEPRETPISVASVLEKKGVSADEGIEVAQDVGCKKFFPAVGMTLSVPCE